MTYFHLRKHDPETAAAEVDDEPAEAETPEVPHSAVGALWAGISGPGRWLTARGRPGLAWLAYGGSAWAANRYGGWTAAGIVVVWLLLVGLFLPPEFVDRVTAWVERRDTPHDAEPEPPEEAPADPRHALARWLLDTIGTRPGIHVRELYPAMRTLPGQETRTDAELKALLKGLGVPVKRSVRIGRIAGRTGVQRADVEALLPSHGGSPVDSGGDAGQGPDSTPALRGGEGV